MMRPIVVAAALCAACSAERADDGSAGASATASVAAPSARTASSAPTASSTASAAPRLEPGSVLACALSRASGDPSASFDRALARARAEGLDPGALLASAVDTKDEVGRTFLALEALVRHLAHAGRFLEVELLAAAPFADWRHADLDRACATAATRAGAVEVGSRIADGIGDEHTRARVFLDLAALAPSEAGALAGLIRSAAERSLGPC
ncbi:MAG: hypothetical protein HY908_03770 [Myxococcales bacterium]|nr:hypothetical protein [Myxococcales bacterium]